VPLRGPLECDARLRGRRQDLLEARAVAVDDERALVVGPEAVEHDSLPVRRPAPRNVVASGDGRDLAEAPAVRRADDVDAVLASVVAERLAEEQLTVRRWDPTGVEQVRGHRPDVLERAVVGIDVPRFRAGRRTAGRDVRAV